MKAKASNWKMLAVVLGVVALACPAGAGAAFTEDFEVGFTGTAIGNHADWGPSGAGPTPTAGSGLLSSVGLPKHGNIFTWTAHPFDWSDAGFPGTVVVKMDFKTDGSGRFDDDRVGWMINRPTTRSTNIRSVQMDPGGSGAGGNIEGYWDGVVGSDKRPSIVDLPALGNNTWYRLEALFTKTAVANEPIIAVDLQLLDVAGNPAGSVASATLDTGTLAAGDRPNAKYFSGTVYPAYKNYNHGFADNAYFDLVPEPATMSLLALGGLALLRRRRK